MTHRSILVISPTHRDRRELANCQPGFDFIFDEYNSEELEKLTYQDGHAEAKSEDMQALVASLVAKYKNVALAGIISSDDYPGSIIASILARELGLIAPSPKALLTCQHKYYSRLAQKEAVPEAVPGFALVCPKKAASGQAHLGFPFFLKPVKSYFSCYAQAIHTLAELVEAAPRSLPHPAFLEPLNQLMQAHTTYELSANYLIAEELLSGFQATIEGYVANGRFGFMGIVDSLMYPGTICFERFVYPSQLPETVQRRVEEIAARCMRHISFDNGIFNIEFFYNPKTDQIQIIEINPRMASQFADLYDKVDGQNTYDIAIDIATGKIPEEKKRRGAYQVAASCVLRSFCNWRVTKVPTEAAICQVQERFDGALVEVLVREGKYLSEELQDGKSYRYGLIQLGAHSIQDLEDRYQTCLKLLDFQFE